MHRFRPAKDSDRTWVWETKKLCLGRYVEQTFGPWDEAVQSALFDAAFEADEIQIISLSGRDVGYVAADHGQREIRLFNIMILPEFQNRGLGTAVMRDLLAEARAQNVPLSLQVLKVNPARRLYERLGFKVTGETATHHQMRWTP